jgi:Ran GTPase-activating protein (RanGAP) involved in mRNA processing and transport
MFHEKKELLTFARISGPAGTRTIGSALMSNSTLTYLDLGTCKMRAQGAADLARGLKGNQSLRALLLPKNNIGDKGASSIAECIPFAALRVLDLASNGIRQTGAAALAQSCANCEVRCSTMHTGLSPSLIVSSSPWHPEEGSSEQWHT